MLKLFGEKMDKSPIQTVNAAGTEIAYEIHGDMKDPIVLLIHGLGMPMTAWPFPMVERLKQQGFCVLRIDNRDQGASQMFDHLPQQNMVWQFFKFKMGMPVSSAYSLMDMMTDAVGVLDELKIEHVHVVGASMGGMIAQLMSIHVPERIKSLTSIMSNHGGTKLKGPTHKVASHLMSLPVSHSAQSIMNYHVKTWQLIGSPGYPTTEEDLEVYVKGLMDRGMNASGTARQMLAIMSANNRIHDLAKLTMPCQVIHGTDDPLVRVEGGVAMAKAIPNAKLHLIEGMGHDFPEALHVRVCGHIADLVKSAEGAI